MSEKNAAIKRQSHIAAEMNLLGVTAALGETIAIPVYEYDLEQEASPGAP
jgi:hypothetical protein